VRGALTAWGIAVLAALSLAHARGLSGGFVYDDHRFVERNPALELSEAPRWFTDPSTASATPGTEPDIYRPLRTAMFAVDRQLFGTSPSGWHWASLALHAANALLVLRLLARILVPPPGTAPESSRTRGLAAAAFGAALFAVHPVTVECVAWISSRGDLLALFLLLLALDVGSRPGAARAAGAAALVALACLAKESAVVGFLLLPLYVGALPASARLPRRATLARSGILLAVAIGYVGLRVAVLPPAKDLPWLAQIGFPEGSRAAAARGMLAGVVGYARDLLWPSGFPFDRNVFTDPVPASWGDPAVLVGGALVLAALLVGVAALRRGRGVLAFATLGPLAALLPVSNVVVPLKAFTADRFLYPALPCLAAGAGALLVAVLARAGRGGVRAAVPVAAVAVVAALGVASWTRTGPWHDDEALWTAAAKEDPLNPRAYEGIGFERAKAGRLSAAERAFRTVREFQPLDGKVHVDLADVLRGVLAALAPAEGESTQGSDVDEKRHYVLGEEIRERGAAEAAWARVGLVRGRGSPPLRRRNLEAWREAAFLYGDYAEAKRVNDVLVAQDVEAAGAPAPAEVTARVRLASLAVTPPLPPPPSDPREPRAVDAWQRSLAEARERFAPLRAALLRDAGVDPALSDPEAAVALLPALERVVAQDPNDLGRRRTRFEVTRVAVRGVPQDRKPVDLLRLMEEDLAAITALDPADEASAAALQLVRQRLRAP
jgi:hypothetical protein